MPVGAGQWCSAPIYRGKMGDWLAFQQLDVDSFDGGITDNYVDAPLNSFKKGDNFTVTTNKKLKTRPGSIQ